jgi:hypothetical protein
MDVEIQPRAPTSRVKGVPEGVAEAQKELQAMSFDPYSIVIRQQELARAELRRADANATQIADCVGRLGRIAAEATRSLRQAASSGATMQLRRTR